MDLFLNKWKVLITHRKLVNFSVSRPESKMNWQNEHKDRHAEKRGRSKKNKTNFKKINLEMQEQIFINLYVEISCSKEH